MISNNIMGRELVNGKDKGTECLGRAVGTQ